MGIAKYKKSNDIVCKNSTNKSNNRNNENKIKKNKNDETNINNIYIKYYFHQNTKEYKIFTQAQNKIFLFCTKTKSAIIIADSFSDNDIVKKYFNNILIKISRTRCSIIILTNNLDYLNNSQQKK